MPSEDSDSVRLSQKMGCNSTTSVKAIAVTTLLIGCLGTQPWSVTGNNDIPLEYAAYAFCKPVPGMSQTSDGEKSRLHPTKITLMLLHKLFIDTKKLLPRAGYSESRIWWWGGIYGECGALAYIGDLGASPQWYLVAKFRIASGGKAPRSWRIISKQMRH